ncbi:hypothetical protein HY213_01350 [Candidatus Peregrinibacteria bacterium]|nr:hypothetical protein [Candidatus Peregrinibacteria bacterium]
MDSTVHTGSTKAGGGVSLAALSFPSAMKERAFLLLQMNASPREAKALEEECAAVVQHSLLSTEGEPWHRLDGTLKELNGLFRGFLASRAIDDVSAIVALLDAGGTLHVSHAGRGEAYLIRGSSTGQITEYTKGKPAPAFVHIASGPLEPRDTVILSTQRLLRTFTPAQLHQLSLRGTQLLQELVTALDAEREAAALATIHVESDARAASQPEEIAIKNERDMPTLRRRKRRRSVARMPAFLAAAADAALPMLERIGKAVRPSSERTESVLSTFRRWVSLGQERLTTFHADLKHPQRKRRAHLLLVAGALAFFLLVWIVVQLSTNTQRSKSRAQLSDFLRQITQELQSADNRKLTGDTRGANTILVRAEEEAKQVINNDSGLFRSEALSLLDRIHAKREELNNVVRLSPRLVVSIASKNPNVSAQGMISVADGEFVVYDRQDWYHVLLNGVEDGKRLADEDLILDGTNFDRYKSQVFLTTGNGVVELLANQPTPMKTEDPSGWATGKDAETYLRYLYILSSDNRIYKYERLSNRYGPSVQYNINGDLSNAIDMAIDGNVYVLKEKGAIVKLLRGETQPFQIHNAPDGVLQNVTKIFKIPGSHFYFLDPVHNRVIVFADGGASGDASYVKQYVFEGDQLGKLQNLSVDPDETHLYVMDDKRLYVADVTKK